MARSKIVLADDHVLVREGLKMILAQRPDFDIAAEAGDGLELLSVLKKGPAPDAVILDINMPKLRGIEAIREIRILHPKTKVLVLTMHKDEDLLCQAFVGGAHGYLLKEDVSKELFAALDTILQSKIYVSSLLGKELQGTWLKTVRDRKALPSGEVLTQREREVLKLVAEGESSKEIGEKLCISTRTVENHRAKIMEKLNLRGTVDLIKYAIAKGFVSSEVQRNTG